MAEIKIIGGIMLARRIDYAALWFFAAVSAFFLMFTLTGGDIVRSVILAFLLLFLLRLLAGRLPDVTKPGRRARNAYAVRLIHQWIFEEESAAVSCVRSVLPDLLTDAEWNCAHFIRRFPENGSFSVNDLLDIWRVHKKDKRIVILATCPADAACLSWIDQFTEPTIRLIDSNALIRRIAETVTTIPVEPAKKEQRPSVWMRVALFARNLRPFRTVFYLLLFAGGFVLTGSRLYLAASALFSALLIARAVLIRRLRVG